MGKGEENKWRLEGQNPPQEATGDAPKDSMEGERCIG